MMLNVTVVINIIGLRVYVKMDRKIALEVLKSYGRPVLCTKTNKVIAFARQDFSDVEDIEKMTDEELIEEWKSLVWINEIYGQVDLNEMQRITLINLEMDVRLKIDVEDLEQWFEEASEAYEREQEKMGF